MAITFISKMLSTEHGVLDGLYSLYAIDSINRTARNANGEDRIELTDLNVEEIMVLEYYSTVISDHSTKKEKVYFFFSKLIVALLFNIVFDYILGMRLAFLYLLIVYTIIICNVVLSLTMIINKFAKDTLYEFMDNFLDGKFKMSTSNSTEQGKNKFKKFVLMTNAIRPRGTKVHLLDEISKL